MAGRNYLRNQTWSGATHVGVELPDEAGEVVVLEVLGQQVPREVGRVPHHEAGAAGAPRHHAVGRRVLHHLVGLDQERRRRERGALRLRLRATLHVDVHARRSAQLGEKVFNWIGLDSIRCRSLFT